MTAPNIRPIVIAFDDHEICEREARNLRVQLENVRHELRLLRAHTAECPRCQAVEQETADKRSADR